MRSAILGAILALVSTCLHAAPIPSSVSADYVGGGWSCRILVYARDGGYPFTMVEYLCTDPQSVQRLGGRSWFGCPVTSAYTDRLYPWWTSTGLAVPPDTAIMITGFDAGGVNVLIDGQPVRMTTAQPIPSPAAFACPSSAPLRFRVFGR